MLQFIGAIFDIILIFMFISMFSTVGDMNDKIDILVAANQERVYQEALADLKKEK